MFQCTTCRSVPWSQLLSALSSRTPCHNVSFIAPFHHQARPLTLLDFLFREVSQLVDLRTLTRHHALGQFDESTHLRLVADGILRRGSLDPNDANARIVRAAIVRAIAKVTDPRFQAGGVVLLDDGAISFNVCPAADRCPLARLSLEGNVDVFVMSQVIGLAGFGVGVEEVVDAGVFLLRCQCKASGVAGIRRT